LYVAIIALSSSSGSLQHSTFHRQSNAFVVNRLSLKSII